MLEMTRDGTDQDRLLRPSRGTSDGPASPSGQGRWQEQAWLDGEPGLLCFVTGKGLWFEPQQVLIGKAIETNIERSAKVFTTQPIQNYDYVFVPGAISKVDLLRGLTTPDGTRPNALSPLSKHLQLNSSSCRSQQRIWWESASHLQPGTAQACRLYTSPRAAWASLRAGLTPVTQHAPCTTAWTQVNHQRQASASTYIWIDAPLICSLTCRYCKRSASVQCEGSCSELVHAVRQHSSWQGKGEPPRVMVVINPVSGQGKCAALAVMC